MRRRGTGAAARRRFPLFVVVRCYRNDAAAALAKAINGPGYTPSTSTTVVEMVSARAAPAPIGDHGSSPTGPSMYMATTTRR